jgi:hypothetical protein
MQQDAAVQHYAVFFFFGKCITFCETSPTDMIETLVSVTFTTAVACHRVSQSLQLYSSNEVTCLVRWFCLLLNSFSPV